MGVPEDIAGLRARVTDLEDAVALLTTKVNAIPPPPTTQSSANSIFAAITTLTPRQRKEMWRVLRDGTEPRNVL